MSTFWFGDEESVYVLVEKSDFALLLWGILALVIDTNHLVTYRVALFHYKQQHYFKAKCFWRFSLLVQK